MRTKLTIVLVTAFLFSVILLPILVNAQTGSSTSIYIRADGNVDGTDLILRRGDLYTFTSNIAGSITIERGNIILDGKGFKLQSNADAFTVEGHNNVTIRNLSAVSTSGTGMLLNLVQGCTVLNVTLEAERAGIRARNLTNTLIADCHIEASIEYALALAFSPNNIIANNTITSHMIDAINCGYSQNNLISGNTLTYHPSQFPLATGIQFDGSTNCTLSQNHVNGFPVTGINLQGYSHNNTIEANDVMNCENGIRISISSNQNILTKNYVANCSGAGISLDSSQNNLLRGNQLNRNGQNLALSSYTTSGWINDVDASNWADLKPIIYWVNEADKVVPSYTGCIILVNCTGITVQNQSFTRKGDAVLMVYTSNSTITSNRASENSTIHLYSSSENNITKNVFVDNGKSLLLESSSFNNIVACNVFKSNIYGVFLSSCSSNTLTENNFTDNQNALCFSSASSNNIYLNNFVNNNRQVSDSGINNPFASVVPATLSRQPTDAQVQTLAHVSVEPANFIGPLSLSTNNWDNGAKGNYWSEYNGTDANADGVGDTAYYLYGNNQDNFPLMHAVPSTIPEFPAWSVLLFVVVSLSFVVIRKVAKKVAQ
jgi:parallel beta-helix repeat protein